MVSTVPPEPFSYSHDVHGSVSQLISDAGSVRASYGYDAYGGPDAPDSEAQSLTTGDPDNQTPLNPFRFSAKRMDSGTATSPSGTATPGHGRSSPSSAPAGSSKPAVPGPQQEPRLARRAFPGELDRDVLDTARVTIPEGKFGYLLKNPSKAGVFKDSIGFDQLGLDAALRSHLRTNFGNASPAVPMVGGGSQFSVRGSMTGPSGQSWDITTAWGVDPDGTLITATT